SDNDYFIKNTATGEYLSVERTASGSDAAASGQATTSDAASSGDNASWTPVWTDEPDEEYGLFHFNRNTGSFAIQSTACRLFLAQNEQRELILLENRQSDASHWR